MIRIGLHHTIVSLLSVYHCSLGISTKAFLYKHRITTSHQKLKGFALPRKKYLLTYAGTRTFHCFGLAPAYFYSQTYSKPTFSRRLLQGFSNLTQGHLSILFWICLDDDFHPEWNFARFSSIHCIWLYLLRQYKY